MKHPQTRSHETLLLFNFFDYDMEKELFNKVDSINICTVATNEDSTSLTE